MGDLRNCRRCGKLFVYTGIPLCRQCIDEDEEIFEKVKEYIESHPKCTTIEVAEALDVPMEKILQFLRRASWSSGGRIPICCWTVKGAGGPYPPADTAVNAPPLLNRSL